MEHASTAQPQASHLALDQIYNETPVGLCAFDTNLRYRSINAWLAALNGIPVEDHLGGCLHVQSEPGQGTQIMVDIPQ